VPSFDVVSELNAHEVANAVDQAGRELSQRFDFKDTGARYELLELTVTLHAQVDFQLKQMLEILKRQRFNAGIPAGLPPGTPVAHKTGTITKIHHDAGIVYAARPYVLVVLVRGIQEEKESAALIAAITRTVNDAIER